MTESPADLVEVQHYVQAQTGLPWDSLGIKHATPQGGGYHEGNDLLAAAGRLTTDYSKRESSRDRPGTNSASAFDLGGEFADFRDITMGIVHACQRADPRTRDIREVIYTPDGQIVLRWDRLGIRTTGDSSHLSHTHLSFFRDSEGRRNQPNNVLGLLRELFEGPVISRGDRMIVMAHEKGSVIDWIGDGVYRYRCPDAAHRANALVVMSLQGNPNPTSVEFNPGTLDALGPVIVSATDGVPTGAGAASVTLSDADMDKLAQKVAALIAPAVAPPSAADIATAVLDEQHRRDAA